MRYSLPFILLILLGLPVQGQYALLSPTAQVEILTADPGGELYSAFGHCAFRIKDEQGRFDRIYNYGTFDFRTEGFYMKFARGKLPYFLSAEGPESFVDDYVRERRTVKSQVLDLTPAEVQAVYEYLENNRLPENKFYPYDFFFDNCATRERDVLQEVLDQKLDWNPWPEDSLGSLRDLLDIYLAERHWEDFGIDLLLGLPADQQADQRLSMFLPDYLHLAVERARVKTAAGWKPLVRENYTWVQPEEPLVIESGFLSPSRLFWGLFLLVLVLSIFVEASRPLWRILDMALFLTIGLLGLLMVFFWFLTDHQATHFNMNLIWALPTHVVFGILRLRRRNAPQFNYARWAIFWYGLAGIACLFIPQAFHAATLPIALLLVTRLLAVSKATLDRP